MKALLIDDSIAMRALERAVLGQIGFDRFAQAESADEALARLDSFEPDLALIDAHLMGADGVSLVERLRMRDSTTPIVLIALEQFRRRAGEAIDAGASTCVFKPFTPDLLSQRVLEAMEQGDA